MTWIILPTTFLNLFAIIGILNVSYYTALFFKQVFYRIRFNEWQKNPQEYKLFLILEENSLLKTKISNLESENAEILNSIINNFKS